MHGFFVDRTAENEMFEVQVFGQVMRIFLAWNKAISHFDAFNGILFKCSTIRLVADFDAHFAVTAVWQFFNRHDTVIESN
jgi:hypothetical protein